MPRTVNNKRSASYPGGIYTLDSRVSDLPPGDSWTLWSEMNPWPYLRTLKHRWLGKRHHLRKKYQTTACGGLYLCAIHVTDISHDIYVVLLQSYPPRCSTMAHILRFIVCDFRGFLSYRLGTSPSSKFPTSPDPRILFGVMFASTSRQILIHARSNAGDSDLLFSPVTSASVNFFRAIRGSCTVGRGRMWVHRWVSLG